MIFDFLSLRDGWKEESRGKRNNLNQQKYRYNLEDNLYDLQYRLTKRLFKPAPLRLKKIYFPKRRVAQVPSQEDKIVQHVICDDHAYYPMVAPLIKEASTNTRGRGTDYGIDLLQKNMRSFWLKYKRPPYILKGDVHSFFYSIPHDRAIKLIDRYIDDDDVGHIMKQFVGLTSLGLPLGLQQSQLLANLYLSEYDHKLKERWRVKYYGRHMDDFYILSNSRKHLEMILEWTEEYFKTIGLELNPKTEIRYRDLDYLGFHIIMSDTGKIITRLAKGKLKSKRRHLRKLIRELGEGKITTDRFEAAYFGWRQYACKAKNARIQIMNMDNYVNKYLNEIGYELIIYKVNKGKVRWRVLIGERSENIQCQEQSQTLPKGQ